MSQQPSENIALDIAEWDPGMELLLQEQPPLRPHTVNTL